jgi:hypothetical protein
MRVEQQLAQVLTIYDAPALDPINVVLQDFGPGNGRIIIECYGKVWTKYWGAMGSQRIAEFFCTTDAGYLVSKLHNDTRRLKKADEEYMLRIIEAVREALRPVTLAQAA